MASSKTDVFCVLVVLVFMLYKSSTLYLNLNSNDITSWNVEQNSMAMALLTEKCSSGLMLNVPQVPRKHILFILLLMCGDIESCPGPATGNKNLQNMLDLKGIKLVHQNIRGLEQKKHLIQTLFTSKKSIITLSETHLETDDTKNLLIPGFEFIHKNRITGEGGGVAMYISDDIEWDRRKDLEINKIEFIWIEV